MLNDVRKPFFYSSFDGGCLVFGIHLLPVKVPYVKNVHNLVHIRGNFGDPDVQAGPEEGICHRKKKAREIVGKDLDDGEKAGVNPVSIFVKTLRICFDCVFPL